MVGKAKPAEAMETLATAPREGMAPKLRTFAPVLQGLLAQQDLERAGELRAQMNSLGVMMGEDEYVGFIVATIARMGQPPPTPGSSDEHDTSTTALASRLRDLQHAQTTVKPASSAILLAAFDTPAFTARGAHARLATMDADGTCSNCGAQLRALTLDGAERERMQSTLMTAARAHHEGTAEDLRRFKEWVSLRWQGHDDVAPSPYVIDAANVGYRNQNIEGGSFSFAQVELARVHLKAKAGGAEPLIVIPRSYLAKHVPNKTHYRDGHFKRRSREDEALVKSWRARGALWATPNGSYDDWYWMLAVLEIGAHARVLTNDEMRDHREHMLLGPHLARWQARHVIHYNFSHSAKEERPLPELETHEPLPYSVEIQSDESFEHWHLPIREEQLRRVRGEEQDTHGASAAEERQPWLCVATPATDKPYEPSLRQSLWARLRSLLF